MATNHLADNICCFVIILLITQVLCEEETTQDMIKKICLHTYVEEEYVFCCRTFNEHLISTRTGIRGLTQITIDRSLHNATSTRNLVLGLLKNATGRGSLKDALVQCNSSYMTLIKAFKLASSYFTRAEYEKVIEAESPGPLAQDKCAWRLDGAMKSGSMDQLVESNREMRILVSMSLVTANYLLYP
ncbi:hypothetical protein SAY87_015367 [Trapa incisa]|uniref:Pectinesterase inhibitor domain-containing protein n=1 Tax=Trapa incisa TaxID=236973 RepID=A0AAN7GLJ9_9MYRT|nr:hypothetical protein SAY87_015367 [Trapa incisa]